MLQAYNYETGSPIAASFGRDLGTYTGPAEKTAGGNFQCNDKICWPIGSVVESTFASLQRQLNRFAAVGGFSPIAIDTFIGTDTLTAVLAVIRVLASQSKAAKAVAAAGTGRAGHVAVATWAAELTQEFKAGADARSLPAAVGAVVGPAAGQPSAGPKPGPTYKAPSLPKTKTPKGVWWTIAVLATTGTIVVGYAIYKRRSQKPARAQLPPRVRTPVFAR